MSETVQQLLPTLIALSPQDRAYLAEKLLISLHGEDDPAEVEAAWDAELARREALINSGRQAAEPVDKVLKELREKYQ